MSLFKKKEKLEAYQRYEPQIQEPPQVLPDQEVIKQETHKAQDIVEQEVKPIKEIQAAPNRRVMVVKEYPMAPVRQIQDKDGTILELITVEDFLTKEANN